jgi:hypothetical protein
MSQTRTADRSTIYRKTNGHCAYCDKELGRESGCTAELPTGAWEVDYWIPPEQAHRFPDFDVESADNLVPACCACRAEKASQTGLEYREKLRQRSRLASRLSSPPVELIERLLRSSPSFVSLRPRSLRPRSEPPDPQDG